MVTRHRQAEADTLGGRERARTGLGLPEVGEHELTRVNECVVEVRVVAVLDLVELEVGDFRVARRAVYQRRRVRDTVGDAAARLSKAGDSGSRRTPTEPQSRSNRLEQDTAVLVLAHHESLLWMVRKYRAAPVSLEQGHGVLLVVPCGK